MLSFDLCTLPSSACWHLLSGLSPHVPAIVSSTASGSSSSPTHYLSLMEERGGLFFFYGVRSVLSSTSSTLPWGPLGGGLSLWAGCKGSWKSEYVAMRTGSLSKEELKKNHQLASNTDFL